MDDITRQLYVERFSRPVRGRNSLAGPIEPGVWAARVHELLETFDVLGDDEEQTA